MQSPFKTILRAGILAGTLDGLAAVMSYSFATNKDPMNVFRFVASGVFGKEAFTGGMAMGLWGILFHYTIAFGWTVLFFVAYPKFKILSKNKIVSGVGYGLFVWLMMNLIVVPLSRVPALPLDASKVITGIIILMVCIGLPISLIVHSHYKNRE